MAYEVVVPIPVRLVWGVFHDPVRLAACIPGLTNDAPPRNGGEGPQFTGRLRLRAGTTTVTYKGTLAVTEAEDLPLALVVAAEGAEARGEAPIKAVLTIRLDDEASSTRLVFDGSVTVQGRTAELSPDQLAAAWRRLADRFGAALAEELAPVRDQEIPELVPVRRATARKSAASQARPVVVPAPGPEPARGIPLLRKFAPPAALVVGALLLGRAVRRRRHELRDPD